MHTGLLPQAVARCQEKCRKRNLFRDSKRSKRAASAWRKIIGQPMRSYRCQVCGYYHVASVRERLAFIRDADGQFHATV
jgi:hypothetical protein